MAASTQMAIFWIVAPCSLAEDYRRFSYQRGLLIALMMEAARPLKRW
jgi:hypothetical protein